jgi:phosphate transport system permease protein
MREQFAKIFSWTSVFIFLILSGVFLYVLVRNGFSGFYVLLSSSFDGDFSLAAFSKTHLIHKLIPAIYGTLLVISLTLFFAAPLGIAIGVWSQLFAGAHLKRVIHFILQLLSSTPSIVLGFAGYFAILFMRQHFGLQAHPCLLLSALCLSLLVLPVLVRSTENALSQLPEGLKITGLSLGLSPLQNALFVLLPRARKGIGRGLFLATLRVAEDSAVILLTGAVADAMFPQSLTDSFSTLSIQILIGSMENRGAQDHRIVDATTLVLVTLTFFLSFLSEKLVGGKNDDG